MPQLQAIADNLWSVRAPQSFLGLHVGTRMTVIRLSNGALVLHSPVPLDDGLRREIDALGPVRHIICPNHFHHLHAGQAVAAWPQALLHGPAKLQRKRQDLRFGATLTQTPHADWNGELVPYHIDGSLLDETVFHHGPSRSLITVDLVENMTRCEHAPTRWWLTLGGIYRRIGWHRLMRGVYRDRAAARASLERILQLPFERVVVAHGDIIEGDAKHKLRGGLAWLLG